MSYLYKVTIVTNRKTCDN